MKDSSATRDVKQAILDAAEHLLANHGYKKMTIDDIARHAGIGKGSVYLHFDSKEEVALSHIDRIIERMKKELYAIAGKGGSAEKRLKAMCVERVMFRFDSVSGYSQSLDALLARIRTKLLERRKRYFEEEAKIFASVIEAGRDAGEFDVRDPLDTARTLLLATNSLLPYSLSAQELGERREIEQRVSKLADVLIHGIAKN